MQFSLSFLCDVFTFAFDNLATCLVGFSTSLRALAVECARGVEPQALLEHQAAPQQRQQEHAAHDRKRRRRRKVSSAPASQREVPQRSGCEQIARLVTGPHRPEPMRAAALRAWRVAERSRRPVSQSGPCEPEPLGRERRRPDRSGRRRRRRRMRPSTPRAHRRAQLAVGRHRLDQGVGALSGARTSRHSRMCAHHGRMSQPVEQLDSTAPPRPLRMQTRKEKQFPLIALV